MWEAMTCMPCNVCLELYSCCGGDKEKWHKLCNDGDWIMKSFEAVMFSSEKRVEERDCGRIYMLIIPINYF